MGLFSKLKANMNHGGVKVRVSAPNAVAGNQVIPVQVTVSADGAQTITSVKAEIKAQMREQGVNLGGGVGAGVRQSSTTSQTVAVAESRDQFTLSPGESKMINFQLYMNGGAANVNPLAAMSNSLGALGGVVQSIAQNFDHVNFLYTVHASADVDGISLDPSDKQPIQLLPPTETPVPKTVAAANPSSDQNNQSVPPIQ